jgi:hypothetical protein
MSAVKASISEEMKYCAAARAPSAAPHLSGWRGRLKSSTTVATIRGSSGRNTRFRCWLPSFTM